MVGSWETDLSSLEVIWSAETYRIFETNASTFHPTHDAFLDLTHPDDRAAVNDGFVQSIGLPGPQAIEHRVLMPDGRVKFVEERWRSFSDEAGRPVRAVGTCQDITDRKLTENALRESDEKFRQLADHITDAFWIRSADMRTLYYISPAFERIWGRSVKSLYASPSEWADFIVPQDRARVLAAFDALAEDSPLDGVPHHPAGWRDPLGSSQRLSGPRRRRRSDPPQRHCHGHHRAQTDRGGAAGERGPLPRPRAVVARADRRDAGGRILFVNPAAVTMMGASSDRQLLGVPVLDLVQPEVRQRVLDRVHPATSIGDVVALMEERVIRVGRA